MDDYLDESEDDLLAELGFPDKEIGCRGLWNLHLNGEWYRCYRPEGQITPPHDELTLSTLDLNYIYTADIDADTFTISLWNELSAPSAVQMNLTKIHEISRINFDMMRKPQYMLSDYTCVSNKAQAKQFETFEIDFGIPTPMNELQERFFTDLAFVWRFYLDDPSTWRYDSPVFRVFCVAFLRLVAWDFEVSFDCNVCNVELPISFASIPLWSYPDADVYWFHGYLLILQDDLEPTAMINGAVSTAKSYVGDSRLSHDDVCLIVISPRHLVFVELSREVALASRGLVLLSNYSGTECSPGFRALARVLTSNCWRKPRAHREKWPVHMPLEVVQMILHELEPRDAVAFSQASFAAEQCYYASESQFKNVDVQSFESSIPCCGERTGVTGLQTCGIRCSECYAWQHLECLGLKNYSFDYRYVCMDCEYKACMVPKPGGIHGNRGFGKREGCEVRAEGLVQSLELRLRKPSPPQLPPELQFLGKLVLNVPSHIQYIILFNNSFSGLAYGLDYSC
ncbi:unnamed protein product [Penicillium salamii]|uniref:Uncharacterized protein n=1 Tax=Penicillium salamii TaxID=1612424 RepID=A0A9W4NL09_9EURO|nr:unnamed protein product [Penicillium salamii]CAG8125400.1 unnamed protein product [Penicillium salamii]CAG8224207.1 unnamed protein product [Penicillium salamii]CAG8305502.1 unnamed protein product [Penicillium salamii]CAG8327548.1 unnamed protein product [Penicillium salamii]